MEGKIWLMFWVYCNAVVSIRSTLHMSHTCPNISRAVWRSSILNSWRVPCAEICSVVTNLLSVWTCPPVWVDGRYLPGTLVTGTLLQFVGLLIPALLYQCIEVCFLDLSHRYLTSIGGLGGSFVKFPQARWFGPVWGNTEKKPQSGFDFPLGAGYSLLTTPLRIT